MIKQHIRYNKQKEWIHLKILVDADACPVKENILHIANKLHIPVVLVADTSHILNITQENVTVVTVDKASDSADFAIANRANMGDIAVTSDYGLASMLLAKCCVTVHPNGFSYTDDNMDRLLFERHISKEARKKHRKTPHIKKRTKEDNERFEKYFYSICLKQLQLS